MRSTLETKLEKLEHDIRKVGNDVNVGYSKGKPDIQFIRTKLPHTDLMHYAELSETMHVYALLESKQSPLCKSRDIATRGLELPIKEKLTQQMREELADIIKYIDSVDDPLFIAAYKHIVKSPELKVVGAPMLVHSATVTGDPTKVHPLISTFLKQLDKKINETNYVNQAGSMETALHVITLAQEQLNKSIAGRLTIPSLESIESMLKQEFNTLDEKKINQVAFELDSYTTAKEYKHVKDNLSVHKAVTLSPEFSEFFASDADRRTLVDTLKLPNVTEQKLKKTLSELSEKKLNNTINQLAPGYLEKVKDRLKQSSLNLGSFDQNQTKYSEPSLADVYNNLQHKVLKKLYVENKLSNFPVNDMALIYALVRKTAQLQNKFKNHSNFALDITPNLVMEET